MVIVPRDVSMSAVTVAGARLDQSALLGSSSAARGRADVDVAGAAGFVPRAGACACAWIDRAAPNASEAASAIAPRWWVFMSCRRREFEKFQKSSENVRVDGRVVTSDRRRVETVLMTRPDATRYARQDANRAQRKFSLMAAIENVG